MVEAYFGHYQGRAGEIGSQSGKFRLKSILRRGASPDGHGEQVSHDQGQDGSNSAVGGGTPIPETEFDRGRLDLVRRYTQEDTEGVLKLIDDEALGHLSPAPYIPDWEDPLDVRKAVFDFYNYCINFPDDTEKFIPTVGVNKRDEVIAFAGLRLRGDPFVPVGKRILSMERLVIHPDVRDHGTGTQFVASILSNAFTEGRYGQNHDQPALEVRAWTMEDIQAGEWKKNRHFMRKLGFEQTSENWPDYRERRGIPDDGRGDATCWKIKADRFQTIQNRNPSIRPCGKILL